MKKIIMEVIPRMADGGAETIVKDYALYLSKDKYELIVVTLFENKECANYKILKAHNIRIVSIVSKYSIIKKTSLKLFGDSIICKGLKDIVQKYRPNCIHLHLAILNYFYQIQDALGNDIRLFYTCHSTPDRYFKGKNEKEFIAAKSLIKDKGLQIIALHNDMRNSINNLFGINNTIVIRNGVDLNKYQNVKETKKEIRSQLGISQDAFVVGHIGRFHYLKNHEFLVKIFKKVADKNDKAFMILVGNGELKNEIYSKLKSYGLSERVLILSNRDDIPRILKAMDVFVFPSIIEGFGIVLVEAQASGLRCIISDTVPKEAFITTYAIPASIKETAEYWANLAFNKKIQSEHYGDILDYSIEHEIEEVEKIYG